MQRLITMALVLMSLSALAQKKKVMVMDIRAEIDPRMNRYTELALEHAKSTNADIIIIDMDTYGGAVNDADDIRTRFLNLDKPIWVFINKDAASAGALISISCDSIYMAPGASIGAATVVMGGSGEAAPDKYQSYMRSMMRSTAEANGRDPKIAEAMVDQTISIDSVTEAGQVITFSTSEAIKHGFCEAQVADIEEILKRNGVAEFELDHFKLDSTEKVISFFLNPFISGLLILVIIGGLYFELQTPGVGFPGAAALIALVLYLVPYYLNGLAANWEIIALFIGVGLLAAEIFVIPGFGVAGISGISLIVISLILIMLDNDFFDFKFVPMNSIFIATAVTMGGITGGFALIFILGPRFVNSSFFKRVALSDTQERSQGYVSNAYKEAMKGKSGVAYTVLRPSGKVMIDGQIYDAYTRGDFIDKDAPVEVVNDEGSSLQVKTKVAAE